MRLKYFPREMTISAHLCAVEGVGVGQSSDESLLLHPSLKISQNLEMWVEHVAISQLNKLSRMTF